MSGFEASWLALRAPYDAAARNPDLLAGLVAWRQQRGPLGLIDLGSGTGATLRALAPVLGGEQRWLLVDHDPALLDTIQPETRRWAETQGHETHETEAGFTLSGDGFSAQVTPFQADLSGGLSALPAQDADIVTASALLDLVSAEWLELLVGFCREHRLACYAALSYDGDMGWAPQDQLDDDLHALFDRHQRGEKSFGLALGPDAARATAACFTTAGFTVQSGRSDWQMAGEDRDMQEALLAGYVQAARELAPDRSAEIDLWRQRRRMAIGIGSSRHRVGHIDILSIPKS